MKITKIHSHFECDMVTLFGRLNGYVKKSFHCRQSRNEIKLISFYMEKKICILILWASSVSMVKAHSTSTHSAVVCVCVCVHVNKTGCCLYFIFFCFTHFSVSLFVLFKWKMPVTVKIWCVLQIYIFFLFRCAVYHWLALVFLFLDCCFLRLFAIVSLFSVRLNEILCLIDRCTHLVVVLWSANTMGKAFIYWPNSVIFLTLFLSLSMRSTAAVRSANWFFYLK